MKSADLGWPNEQLEETGGHNLQYPFISLYFQGQSVDGHKLTKQRSTPVIPAPKMAAVHAELDMNRHDLDRTKLH